MWNALAIQKCILTWAFNAALPLVAGLLQVSTDELLSALTTDIQYLKGKCYSALMLTFGQFVVSPRCGEQTQPSFPHPVELPLWAECRAREASGARRVTCWDSVLEAQRSGETVLMN